MKTRRTPLIWGAIGLLGLTFLDQWTKYLASHYLAGTSGIQLIPGVFELYYLENKGAAFGIMTNRQWFFILIAAVMTLLAVYVYVLLPSGRYYLSLRVVCLLIASGAVGNMIDRIFHNYVIDFLYFSLIDFPIFNVADCYVCIGAALTVLLIFTLYKEEKFAFLVPGRSAKNEKEHSS